MHGIPIKKKRKFGDKGKNMKCVCTNNLEQIAATQPKLTRVSDGYNYKTVRQIFNKCKNCNRLYSTNDFDY